MVKTMDAVEHRTLLQMLPGLCAHLQTSSDERGAPRSLLTRISGVYSIRMYAGPCAEPCVGPVLARPLSPASPRTPSLVARSPHACCTRSQPDPSPPSPPHTPPPRTLYQVRPDQVLLRYGLPLLTAARLPYYPRALRPQGVVGGPSLRPRHPAPQGLGLGGHAAPQHQ